MQIHAIEIGFTYDPTTGRVTNGKGNLMESRNGDYTAFYIKKDGKKYRVNNHRFAWFFHYGYLPEYIDHKNHDGTDNRITNLRESTVPANAWNNHNNKEWRGYTQTRNGKYRVQLKSSGKRIHIGYFETEEMAKTAYLEARKKYHQI